jgi:phosphohistidine phosphatase SixA
MLRTCRRSADTVQGAHMLRLFASLALAAHIATPVEDTAKARREDLMAKLRTGGYSVLMRHARTDYSVQEPQGTMPAERSAQRNLSDDGIRDAALMGVVFRKYGISFAEIISSPMFRTVETAEMAAGKPKTTMALRVIPSTPEQEALIKTAPKPGTNRLLVTHHFVIEKHVPGVKPGGVGESEAAVVSHAADGTIQLVGIIKLDDWKALANPGSGVAPTAAPAAGVGHGAPPPAPKPSGLPAVIPNTTVGTLVRGYVAAFNSGDVNTMRKFVESSLIVNPERSTDERLKSYLKLFEDHGALSLVSVDSASATKVTLGMRSKRGTLSLTLAASDADPMRAASVTFAFMEPPR